MKIREEFLVPTKSYTDNIPEATSAILDCSLGVNPYGFPPPVKAMLEGFDWERLVDYSHSHVAENAICTYWKDYSHLACDNITLTDGSISALYLINNLFAKPKAEVVGFIPAFTNMIGSAQMFGMCYTAIPMTAEHNYQAQVDLLLEVITADTALVYIDNPNNPTGQTLPVSELERIVARAEELGVYTLIDEAYGDFIPREESILSCYHKYQKLIVTRTFSKGFGLAGLRAGYIVASPELTGYLSKISNPYMMNELSREAIAAALQYPNHPTANETDFISAKETIRKTIGAKLMLLHTDDRVPICTLRHQNTDVNLQLLLYEHGILTVSGADFDGLDKNSVRLRIPKSEDVPRLLAAIHQIEK